MLILTAGNVTGYGQLEKDGLADYTVWVGVNYRQIWAGPVKGHVRANGAAELLRRIADHMDGYVSEPGKASPIGEAVERILETAYLAAQGTENTKINCVVAAQSNLQMYWKGRADAASDVRELKKRLLY
jgi:hypothetical protein